MCFTQWRGRNPTRQLSLPSVTQTAAIAVISYPCSSVIWHLRSRRTMSSSKSFPQATVDVGANKPFKGRVRTHWQEWLVSEGLANAANDGKVQPPTRRLIADWCLAAYQSVPTQNIINAWRKTGPYTWFAATCAQRPIGWIDPIDFAEEEEHELAQV